jgi:peptidyl-prolyl cis-trans isomerase SurA
MERRKIAALAALVLGITAGAQTAQNDPVLMTVDGQPVTRNEFEAIYKKNNKDAPVNKEALDEYLDLFINYKLKVRDAEMHGLDTVTKFKSELDGYRKQLARPYLVDKDLSDALIKEAYDRAGTEVRASHILVQVASDAQDTTTAWKRIMDLRAKVAGGQDFAEVAKMKGGSDDPSAQQNGGDLGYFSAMQMVYPFETVAYKTQVGELSQPVRTRFGYHIIKVTDKRPARGQMRAAHIMVRSAETDTPEKQAEAERRIREVYTQLIGSPNAFADLALKYSEDEGSNTKGGELAMFGTGKMIEEFENAAFGLKADGDISAPVRTRFGWHIIKRLEYKAPPTFDEAKADLKSKIGRDSRAERTRRAFLDKLRAEYNYTANEKNLKALVALMDSSIFRKGSTSADTLLRSQVVEGPFMRGAESWKREIQGTLKNGKLVGIRGRKAEETPTQPSDTVVVREVHQGWQYDRTKAAKYNKPLFTVNDRTWTQTDFLNALESRQRKGKGQAYTEYLNARFKEYVDDELMAYEDARLEKKHSDFRLLMKEYRDGILLFELTDQKVWSKAVKDSVGLEAFFNEHRTDYLWETRYQVDVYTCADANIAKQTRALLAKGKRDAALTDLVNKTSALNLSVESGRFTLEEKPFLKQVTQPGLSADIAGDSGQVLIVDAKEIFPPSPKTLEEARGLATAAYQDQLEKDWLKELRAKYPVVVSQDVLYSIK